MAFTKIFKGKFADRLRNEKHFLEWFRESDVSEKMLRNSRYTSESFREFVKCVDIEHVKPPVGWKRRFQLDTLKIASDFCRDLEREGIHPYAWAGTLIGAVRHNGFIPWDDDMDFYLIHPEYDRMIEYCKKYHNVIFTSGKNEVEDFEQIDKFCSEHMGERILILCDQYAKLTIGDTHVKRITIDFFSIDFIKEDVDFKTYSEYRNSIRSQAFSLPREEREAFFRNQEKKNPYASDVMTSRLFWGVDFTGRWTIQATDFLPTEYIYPLKKIPFEDSFFLCPAMSETLLDNYLLVDYKHYPKEFASFCLPSHEETYGIWFREHEKKAELIVTSEKEIQEMLPLYNKLRDNNVFALFINCIPEDIWGFILDKYEVRWSAYRDFKSQFAVAMSESAHLKDYKNEKIIFDGNTKNALERICEK